MLLLVDLNLTQKKLGDLGAMGHSNAIENTGTQVWSLARTSHHAVIWMLTDNMHRH